MEYCDPTAESVGRSSFGGGADRDDSPVRPEIQRLLPIYHRSTNHCAQRLRDGLKSCYKLENLEILPVVY